MSSRKNKDVANKNKNKKTVNTRDLILKFDSEKGKSDYARIVKVFGNGRYEVELLNREKNEDDIIFEKEEIKTISGHLRRGLKMKKGIPLDTIVLCGFREYQNDVLDIIHIYTDQEVLALKRLDEIRGRIKKADDWMETEEERNLVPFDFDNI